MSGGLMADRQVQSLAAAMLFQAELNVGLRAEQTPGNADQVLLRIVSGDV